MSNIYTLALRKAAERARADNHTQDEWFHYLRRSTPETMLWPSKGGGIPRLQADIKQMILAPIGAHSAKPEECRRRLERLYGDVPRIELFSRGDDPAWHHWGNECDSSVILTPAMAAPVNDNKKAKGAA